VGFLEYAWSIFFEKDKMKTKLLLADETTYPQLHHDGTGFVCVLPEPSVKKTDKDETISLMGYSFPADAQGKRQLASLFRSAVFHLGAHTMSSNFEDYNEWKKHKDPKIARFTTSLIEDVKANAYIASSYPDRLTDIAFANVLTLGRLREISKILNPATRLMAGLLVRANMGIMPDGLKEENVLVHLAQLLEQFKEKAVKSLTDENVKLKEDRLKIADDVYNAILDAGATTETPFFPHMEELGTCSIFSRTQFIDSDVTLGNEFKKCLEFLGGNLPTIEDKEETRKKMADIEAVQIFDSWQREKEKDAKILAKYQNILLLTRFKSVTMPPQDHTEYLRTKSRCKSEAHRLIESLLVARDAIDEDPKKLYGVLDLQEVIQVIASKSPSLDVFMLDENMSKSYSWIILFDASKSMKCVKEFALDLLIMLCGVASELLQDQHSWAVYAFNDRLSVIKDLTERYNTTVKARIGGLNFEGFTYMPDALMVAGQVIKSRAENMRLITVISDGWPYGYPDVNTALSEALNTLAGGNIAVIGIGAQSRRMEFYFKSCSTVYTLRDLTKKFSNLYMEASSSVADA